MAPLCDTARGVVGESVRTAPRSGRRSGPCDSGDRHNGDHAFRRRQWLRNDSTQQQPGTELSNAHPNEANTLRVGIVLPDGVTHRVRHPDARSDRLPSASVLSCAIPTRCHYGLDLHARAEPVSKPEFGCGQSTRQAQHADPKPDPPASASGYLRPRRPQLTHQRRIDRLNPALIVMLVDQSDSMSEPIAGGTVAKSAAVADQINRLIYELVLRCVKTPREPPRPYFHLAVFGYSTDAMGERLIVSGLDLSNADSMGVVSVTDLAGSPRRVDEREISGNGQRVRAPVWVEPVSRGGTPMCTALERGGRIAASWVKRYPKAFPPIIINLSDGESTDGNPLIWGDRVRSLQSEDGSVLLFNINISGSDVTPALFPASFGDSAGQYARDLFTMSSVLPPGMVASAQSQGMQLAAGARGFAFNADMNALALFLNVGTSVGRVG